MGTLPQPGGTRCQVLGTVWGLPQGVGLSSSTDSAKDLTSFFFLLFFWVFLATL